MKPDYRTREGREAEVLAEVSINGGISLEWAGVTPQRSTAVTRLVQQGRIRPLGQRGDFLRFEIVERRQPRRTFFQWLDSLFMRRA